MVVRAQERTGLFAGLTAATAALTVGLLFWRGHLLVPVWVVVAIALPWVAFSIYLRVHRDDALGREGRWVDWWTIPHVAGGALLGLFDLGLAWAAALVAWWELAEVVARVFEHPTNRVVDVVIALAGCATVQLALTGALRMI